MLLITGATGHSGEWFIKMLISEKYDKRTPGGFQLRTPRRWLRGGKGS